MQRLAPTAPSVRAGVERYGVRVARRADIAAIHALIREHGPSPWNYLAEPALSEHLRAIGNGVDAVLAHLDEALVAVVTYADSDDFACYQSAGRERARHGHIGEVVVHRDHRGAGLGARLLGEAVAQLRARGLRECYAERHEENAGSAGMMRKAGFVVVDSFHDPVRRNVGSCRTAVCVHRSL
ncbi:GNAT family N-acetyltransferase [Lysobacter sp. cf310]|uniref:GNAT family N-acetyltransferase n=1 Tax=Lysobacter sp. cf310 TaxID=1761790 RepID=UPI0008E4FEA0|nr:GNAT family N-acetyltransferase [Lysobacter sp. cf310]SFK50141.1 Acetyltransferase (GNAT) family protein [Lysobacter sp. cf310]